MGLRDSTVRVVLWLHHHMSFIGFASLTRFADLTLARAVVKYKLPFEVYKQVDQEGL